MEPGVPGVPAVSAVFAVSAVSAAVSRAIAAVEVASSRVSVPGSSVSRAQESSHLRHLHLRGGAADVLGFVSEVVEELGSFEGLGCGDVVHATEHDGDDGAGAAVTAPTVDVEALAGADPTDEVVDEAVEDRVGRDEPSTMGRCTKSTFGLGM